MGRGCEADISKERKDQKGCCQQDQVKPSPALPVPRELLHRPGNTPAGPWDCWQQGSLARAKDQRIPRTRGIKR